MRVRNEGRSAVLAIAALLAAAIPGTAMASGAAPQAPAQHCSFFHSTGKTECYGSYEEVTQQARARGDVIQATLFTEPDYGGSSFTVYGSGLCEKDGVVNYQINLPDEWKNAVSSVQPWGGCWIWLYPEPDLGGERDGPFKENTADVGEFMNDRTQSVGLS